MKHVFPPVSTDRNPTPPTGHDKDGTPLPGQRLLSSLEAAQILHISERTLWTIRKEGRLPFIKMRRCVRYRLEDLMRYIDVVITDSGVAHKEAA